jgi:hypothetical protein
MKIKTYFKKLSSHSYLFGITIVQNLYRVFKVYILKLKLHQIINTMEIVTSLIWCIVFEKVLVLK